MEQTEPLVEHGERDEHTDRFDLTPYHGIMVFSFSGKPPLTTTTTTKKNQDEAQLPTTWWKQSALIAPARHIIITTSLAVKVLDWPLNALPGSLCAASFPVSCIISGRSKTQNKERCFSIAVGSQASHRQTYVWDYQSTKSQLPRQGLGIFTHLGLFVWCRWFTAASLSHTAPSLSSERDWGSGRQLTALKLCSANAGRYKVLAITAFVRN